jgi:hypothetical protein
MGDRLTEHCDILGQTLIGVAETTIQVAHLVVGLILNQGTQLVLGKDLRRGWRFCLREDCIFNMPEVVSTWFIVSKLTHTGLKNTGIMTGMHVVLTFIRRYTLIF